MKFARFASGRCGVPSLERVMEDSVDPITTFQGDMGR